MTTTVKNRDVRRCRLPLNDYRTIIFTSDYRQIASDDRGEHIAGAKQHKPLNIVAHVFHHMGRRNA